MWQPTLEEFERTLRPIWDFLTVRDQPSTADAIFVFGGPFPVVAEGAAALYHRKLASKVVVTGSRGTSSDPAQPDPEGIYFARILQRRGVPESAVVVEQESIHTGDNVRFGMEALRRKGVEPRSLILVTHPYHSLRCVATFRNQFPSVVLYSCPPTGGPAQYLRGRTTEVFAKRIMEELDRIRDYPARGFIVWVPVPELILRVEQRVRALLEE